MVGGVAVASPCPRGGSAGLLRHQVDLVEQEAVGESNLRTGRVCEETACGQPTSEQERRRQPAAGRVLGRVFGTCLWDVSLGRVAGVSRVCRASSGGGGQSGTSGRAVAVAVQRQ